MSRFTNTSITTAQVRRFARHYGEMVIAMFAGMLVLGVPAEGVLQLAGSSFTELTVTAPAIVLLAMGISMTVPMVAWMRYRGHGWQPSMDPAMLAVMLARWDEYSASHENRRAAFAHTPKFRDGGEVRTAAFTREGG